MATDYMHERLEELLGAPNYHAWLRELAEPWLGPSLLEVGAGVGNMTEHFRDLPRVVALELEEGFADRLRDRFAGHPNVEVLVGDATDAGLMRRLAAAPFDCAVSYNVFEHIEDDRAAFREVFEVLRPGGHFVCFVPAGPSIYGSLDLRLGHHRRYRAAELREKAEAAGFAVASLRYVNLPGYFGWGFNNRLVRADSYVGGGRAVQLWDQMVIPLARRLERIWSPPFGQSLLLVGRRQG